MQRRLLKQVRDWVRRLGVRQADRHSYVRWVKKYIFFHGKRQPRQMGKAEVEAFLTSLAVERHVAGATQRAAAWMKRAGTRDVLTVTSPYSAALHTGYQLPAGGKRMIAEARGVDCTIVNGRLVFDRGRHTGALPGVAVN